VTGSKGTRPKAIAALTAGVPRARTPSTKGPGHDADAALLPRVAAGEPGAARECLDTFGGLIWTIARSTLGPGPDAEDAVQEIFIEIWRSAGRYDPAKGTEKTFVATIARRRVVDWVRRRQRQPKSEPLADDRVTEADEGAEHSAALADDYARARAALEQLPAQRRRVLTMAVLKGATHSEVARDLGLPLGTVKTHVRRGLIRIREILGRTADDEPGEEDP